jgi:hypothetical protein
MPTFVQLGGKKWFISLIFASAFISLLDRGKKYEIYQLFKDNNIPNPLSIRPLKTVKMV